MDVKFYKCLVCGNLVYVVEGSGITPTCCGGPMELLEPKSKDSGLEKHLPVVERIDECTLKVMIGSMPHPMEDKHHIQFVCLETRKGVQIKHLKAGDKPEVVFHCPKGEAIAVYEYCNIHGFWKTKMDEAVPCCKC